MSTLDGILEREREGGRERGTGYKSLFGDKIPSKGCIKSFLGLPYLLLQRCLLRPACSCRRQAESSGYSLTIFKAGAKLRQPSTVQQHLTCPTILTSGAEFSVAAKQATQAEASGLSSFFFSHLVQQGQNGTKKHASICSLGHKFQT